MEFNNLEALQASLKRGQPLESWQKFAHLFKGTPEDLKPVADELATVIRRHFSDIDPVVQEKFIGFMFMGIGYQKEGKALILRAAQWEDARKKGEKDFGIDFRDPLSLYHFLGSVDFNGYSQDDDSPAAASNRLFLDDKTVAWLYVAQQMEKVLPLTKNFPNSSWLTLGDGRHAFEARYLQNNGVCAFPTNLDPTLLEEAKEMGLIAEYGVENMEKLSFGDQAFDFVCCKDSLHHSMQPYKALYEMLRVAKEGIFLIEPWDDGYANSAICQTRNAGCHYFEEGPGNYAYSFSERELEKLGVSHGWSLLAARGICCPHDYPVDLKSALPADCAKQRRIVEDREELARQNKMGFTNICAILLRNPPSAKLREDLFGAGYSLVNLARNPHLLRDALRHLADHYARKQKDA